MTLFLVPPTIPLAAAIRHAAAAGGSPDVRLERRQTISGRALTHIVTVGRVAAASRFKGWV
jgi:hypothetical protein